MINNEYESRKSSTRRSSDLWIAAFVGACVVYAVVVSPFRPWLDIVSKIPDDAAYYFQIGRNYLEGRGLTFDGHNPTNGFQPLWQTLIALMGYISPLRHQPEQLVRTVLVFQGVFLTAALMLFNRTLAFLDNSRLRNLGIVIFIATVYLMIRDGMESALLVLLAVTAVYVYARHGELDRWSRRQCIGFGALLGCLLLARLDSVFWISAQFATLVLLSGSSEDGQAGRRLRKAALIGFTCVAIVIPYFAGNYFVYNHLMPISGALKTSFPKPGFYLSTFSLTPDTKVLLLTSLLLSVACLLWEFGPWRHGPGGRLRGPACALALGVVLHVGYAVLFMKWAVFSWHFVLERFAVCLLLPYLCAKVAVRVSPAVVRWATSSIIALVVCATPLIVSIQDWHPDLSRSWKATSYQASQWVKANLPPDATLAMKDAGNMGYFSDRSVVNLDGLVNSFAYQDALRDGRFRKFLRDSGVGYLVQHAVFDDPAVNNGEYDSYTFRSYSHLYDRPGGDLTLKRSDEIYRSAPYYDGNQKTVLVIWRIPRGNLNE